MRTRIISGFLFVFLVTTMMHRKVAARQATPASQRYEALQKFRTQTSNDTAIARWHSERQSPASIRGAKLYFGRGNSEEIAERALYQLQNAFGIMTTSDAVLSERRMDELNGPVYQWNQYYKQLPVFGTGIVIAVGLDRPKGRVIKVSPTYSGRVSEPIRSISEKRDDWYVYHISATWYPDISVDTSPRLTDDDAWFVSSSIMSAPGAVMLGIYVSPNTNQAGILVYKINGRDVSGSAHTIILDANTGEVLDERRPHAGVAYHCCPVKSFLNLYN